MKMARTLLILGIWTAILPHLGFSGFIKNILFLLTGLALTYLGFTLYRKTKGSKQDKVSVDSFSENGDFENEELGAESFKGERE